MPWQAHKDSSGILGLRNLRAKQHEERCRSRPSCRAHDIRHGGHAGHGSPSLAGSAFIDHGEGAYRSTCSLNVRGSLWRRRAWVHHVGSTRPTAASSRL